MFVVLYADRFSKEMNEWCYAKGWKEYSDFLVRPHEVCTKHVMIPTENDQNEYMTDGVEIWFNDKNKSVEFKLRWAEELKTSAEGIVTW